jgi:DcuC family C4-dicarboxylate transporter
MPAPLSLVLGCLVVTAAVVGVARRVDVRLVLFLAALALGAIAGNISPIIQTFLSTFSSDQFIVPICSAMGFAQVLRHSGCDQHLVQLLVKPIRRFHFLMIPGAVLVGFIVNVSVISQTSTAVAVGAVLVPLLRAARFSSKTIGATLLLGSSVGGELLNPGAPEMNTVARVLKTESQECIERVFPLLLVQLAVATAVFWWMSVRSERSGVVELNLTNTEESSEFRVNYFKAAVPVIPLVLLMIVGPPLNLVSIPREWLVADPSQVSSFSVRLIGVSMLIGAVLAAVAAPGRAGAAAKVYFEGAGFAFTNIVSLIVVAACFGAGIKLLNLDAPVRTLIGGQPELIWPLAGTLTLAFAALSGSGMAATQSLFEIYAFRELGTETLLRVGALTSIAAAAGRTMSPVAAVVLTCGKLTESDPLAVARRVAIPLLIATATTITVAWWRG